MIRGVYDEIEATSPVVRCWWRARPDADGTWLAPADEYWGLHFFRRADGATGAEVSGPSVGPRELTYAAGDEYWGFDLRAHVFCRGVDKPVLIGDVRALAGGPEAFEIGGASYPIPRFEELEDTVSALVDAGVLVCDAEVEQALRGSDPALSERSLQRRFRSVTGLRRGEVAQLRRARAAYALLQRGVPIARAAAEAGYADQAHLTRSLRRFAGQTPRQILLG